MAKDEVSRRAYAKYAAAGVVGIIVGAAGGYYGAPRGVTEKTVTETQSQTFTKTVAEGVAPTPTEFDWATVGKQFAGEKVTVLVESGTRMDKWLDMIAPEWKEMTGIEMEVVPMAFSQMGEAASTDFLAGTGAYDIVYMVNFWGGLLAVGDHFYPMADLFNEYPDLHSPDFVEENFIEKHMDLVAYWDVEKKINGRPGKLTLISVAADSQIYYYRTDLFEDSKNKEDFESQYGYELKVPETWDQFHEISEFFTRPDQKMYGESLDGTLDDAASDFWVRFLTEGGQIWKYANGKWPPDNFTPNMDSREVVQAFEWLREELQWAPPGASGYGQVEATDAFITQDIAQMSAWWFQGGKSQDPSVSKVVGKVGYAINPGKDRGRCIIGGWGAGVSRYSKHIPAAFLTIEWLKSPEIEKRQQIGGYFTPGLRQTYLDPEVVAAAPYLPVQLESMDRGESHHINFTTVSFELLTHIVEEGRATISGDKDPEDAANALQERWIKSLQREGYKVD